MKPRTQVLGGLFVAFLFVGCTTHTTLPPADEASPAEPTAATGDAPDPVESEGPPQPVPRAVKSEATPQPVEDRSDSTGINSPGTEQEARSLLTAFLDPNADHEGMTKKLQPAPEDYDAIFIAEGVAKARSMYATLWNERGFVIRPNEGQTELLLWKATTDELRSGTGNTGKFPGGYAKTADKLKPGVVFYRFKFVKPGEPFGMAYDGLTFVNGHWVIVPKPYRVFLRRH